MTPRLLSSLAVITCLLPGGLLAMIPESIYECYQQENYAVFNRINRQGMSIGQLIGLLEKLEHNTNVSPQRLAAMLLQRFRYDGIIDQTVNQDISYLEPFTFIQPENAKFQMLQRITNLGNINFPDDTFTLEERCTMHWLLSHTVNETKRADEDDFCGRQGRRRRRSPRRQLRRKGSASSSTSTAGNAGFVGNLADDAASACPLELGVAYCRYGPVAAGTLLAGLAAGLSEQDVAVEDAVGAETSTLKGLSTQQRRLQINNIWASTIAGDIAQTALHYESRSGAGRSQPAVIGPSGVWNSTYCPREFSLAGRDVITALTNAEIYGGIDGYLLGSRVKDWTHNRGFRLSNLLRMYYSPDGVSYDTQLRACDRLRNFQNSDLVDPDTLKTQSVNFAYAYYAADLGKMATFSQDGLDDGMNALVSAVISQLNSFTGGSMDDDGPGCRDVPPSGQQPDNPYCHTMADLTIVMDPSQGDSSVQAQKVFISEMTLAMSIGWNMSHVHVVSGIDGTVLADKWNYTNQAQLACDVQRLNVRMGRTDYVKTVNALTTYYSNMVAQNRQDNIARSNTQVVLLLQSGTRINNEDDLAAALNSLCDTLPDIAVFTLADNGNVFRGVQQRMDRRQFNSDNMFTWEATQQAIRDQLVPKVNEALCQTPSRLVYPACDPSIADRYTESQHEYTYYLTPSRVSYLKLGPQQFFSSSDLKLIFETSYGSLKFCISRLDVNPADGDDGVVCIATETTSTSQVEHDMSEPCSEDYHNDNCAPIFISIQQNPGAVSSDLTNLCSDDDCPFPDSIQYTITHQNMRCAASAAMAAPLLLLAAAIFLRQLAL